MNSKSKPHFSISQLRTYQDCPARYHFRYILKLLESEKPLYYASGKAVHEALKTYYKTGNEKKAKMKLAETLAIEAQGVKLKKKESLPKELRILLSLLEGYFKNSDKPRLKPLLLEKRFRRILKCPVTGKRLSVAIEGIIDQVTKDGWVVEYKTSSGKWTQEKADNDEQVVCYALWYLQRYGKMPKGILFIILIKRVWKPQYQFLFTHRDKSQMQRFIDGVEYVLGEIRDGVFPKREGKRCDYCQYHDICT